MVLLAIVKRVEQKNYLLLIGCWYPLLASLQATMSPDNSLGWHSGDVAAHLQQQIHACSAMQFENITNKYLEKKRVSIKIRQFFYFVRSSNWSFSWCIILNLIEQLTCAPCNHGRVPGHLLTPDFRWSLDKSGVVNDQLWARFACRVPIASVNLTRSYSNRHYKLQMEKTSTIASSVYLHVMFIWIQVDAAAYLYHPTSDRVDHFHSSVCHHLVRLSGRSEQGSEGRAALRDSAPSGGGCAHPPEW